MFIVGIDLGNEYSQVCYYNVAKGEPESVAFQMPAANLRVPTVVLKEYGKDNGWMAGEVALSCNTLGEGVLFDGLLEAAKSGAKVEKKNVSVMPSQLIRVYLTFLLQSAKRAFGSDEEPDVICITTDDYCEEILDVIDEAVGLIGISKDKVIYSGHVESFVYYALSSKPELWKNDNVVFDYGRDGLVYCRMATMSDMGRRIVMSEKIDLKEVVGYTIDMDELEEKLLSVSRELFDRKLITTVYITGEGFEGDFSC